MNGSIGTVSTRVGGLKLRQSAPNGHIIDELMPGDRVEILGRKNTDTVAWFFVQVLHSGRHGYVMASAIDVDPIIPPPIPPPDVEPPPPPPAPLPPPTRDRSWLWIVVALAAAAILVGLLLYF